MGKPSSTNPMREFLPTCRAMLRDRLRWCAVWLTAMLLGLAGAEAVRAQTQTVAVPLPLLYPSAIVFDAQGNLYFSETVNHVVCEFTPTGVLTTVVGTGVQGFSGDNGLATLAELDSPSGLALDSSGNLYIADTHNQRVRKLVVGSGIISTVAGVGTAGFGGDGGPATAALLSRPTALAVDTAGNVYIADSNNHRIRKIAAGTGVITTVAGDGLQAFAGDDGKATAAAIDSPNGLALDSAGNLYIADTHNGRIRKINAASGTIASIAGVSGSGGFAVFSGDGGPATSAALALPRGLTLDAAGNLYVADSANHRIRFISTGGATATIATVAGQGTEAFTGDGAPAALASLDSPGSVALSPAGLLTLADTGNDRIRQLDSLPAPGPNIHTLVGVDSIASSTLALSGSSLTPYGSGSVVATLTTSTPATGNITFLDTRGAAVVFLANDALVADAATFSTSTLSAGIHQLVASYAGDATHSTAQSPSLSLMVAPLRLTLALSPATVLYGLPVPAMSGTLSGVLPQDAGNLAAVFSTTAATLSPAGLYPIAATLTGTAASNYSVTTTPANFTIAQAPTLTALSASASTLGAGLPVTLNVQANSTTSGVPTGSITLLDGGSSLSVLTLLATGGAAYTTSSLSVGSHSIAAVYSGDTNFLPSTSASAAIIVGAVGPASDFSIASSGANSQTVPAGSAATFAFSVTTQGAALTSPITLAVAGVPLGSTSSINPQYLPPGGSVTAFAVTIQTPIAELTAPPRLPELRGPAQTLLAILLLPGVTFMRSPRLLRLRYRTLRRSRLIMALIAASSVLLATMLSGCGNRVNIVPESVGSTTYTLTVTGTATSPAGTALQHSVNVSLQVQSAK